MATGAASSAREPLSLPTASHSGGPGSGPNVLDRVSSLAGGLKKRMSRSSASLSHQHAPKWWKIRLFQGMIHDIRRRAPFYWSDWIDAWDYRVIPATVYMYFAK